MAELSNCFVKGEFVKCQLFLDQIKHDNRAVCCSEAFQVSVSLGPPQACLLVCHFIATWQELKRKLGTLPLLRQVWSIEITSIRRRLLLRTMHRPRVLNMLFCFFVLTWRLCLQDIIIKEGKEGQLHVRFFLNYYFGWITSVHHEATTCSLNKQVFTYRCRQTQFKDNTSREGPNRCFRGWWRCIMVKSVCIGHNHNQYCISVPRMLGQTISWRRWVFPRALRGSRPAPAAFCGWPPATWRNTESIYAIGFLKHQEAFHEEIKSAQQ